MADERIYLNQSRVQFYLDCKRKYWWQFEEGLEPDRPRWALEIGKAVHEGLAALGGGGKSIDQAIKIAQDSLEAGMPKRVFDYDLVELEQNKELIDRMLRAYHDKYGTSAAWVAIGHEVAGCVEVGSDTGVFLVFRTDKIVTWRNHLWIIDHKTAAKMDMRDLQKYEMDLQFTAYVYGASKVLEQRVYGIIVDVLVKTKVPQFHQEMYVRSDRELEEFEREFVELAKNIQARRARVAAGEDPKVVFYKNTKECFRYGTCPYRDLCLEDTAPRRAVFVKRKPDYVDTAPSTAGPDVDRPGSSERAKPDGPPDPAGTQA